MTPTWALVHLVASAAQSEGMGGHSYIVGGAPRDFVLGHEVKDIDIVVEPRDGKNAATLGGRIGKMLGISCHPDHYGVVHIGPVMEDFPYMGVNLKGQKVEVVTSRKEKYDRTRGKESHKPSEVAVGTILEDLERRDFTINTLMWRLADLAEDFQQAPVLDLLGRGLDDLKNGSIRTPLDPKETFDDDPSRMLRAVRFAVKYGFAIGVDEYRAIQEKNFELTRLPYEAIDPLFFDKIMTLPSEKMRQAIMLMDCLNLLSHVKGMIPVSRQKRAVSERVTNLRDILYLAGWGIPTSLTLSQDHLERWQALEQSLTDDELTVLHARYLKPIDTAKYIQVTGAVGKEIGYAVSRAKDFVLLMMPPEEVFQLTVDTHGLGSGLG